MKERRVINRSVNCTIFQMRKFWSDQQPRNNSSLKCFAILCCYAMGNCDHAFSLSVRMSHKKTVTEHRKILPTTLAEYIISQKAFEMQAFHWNLWNIFTKCFKAFQKATNSQMFASSRNEKKKLCQKYKFWGYKNILDEKFFFVLSEKKKILIENEKPVKERKFLFWSTTKIGHKNLSPSDVSLRISFYLECVCVCAYVGKFLSKRWSVVRESAMVW